MNAPTIWEEGQMSGSRVTRLVVLASVFLIGLDLLLTGRLSPLFDIGFVTLSIAAALVVRPKDFFGVAMLPPFLLLGLCVLLSLVARTVVAQPGDGPVQAVVSGLANHSGALFAAFANALVVIAIRVRMKQLRLDRLARATSPYSKRVESPAPMRVTSAAPEEKSTTVVGSEESVPQSRTASSF